MPSKIEIPSNLRREIRRFFTSISQSSRKKSKYPYLYIDQQFMWDYRRHQVYLDHADKKRFNNIILKLHLLCHSSTNYDKKYAESNLKKAIYDATNPIGYPADNVSTALSNLIAAYDIELRDWKVYVPVTGFDMSKKTIWKFGNISFVRSTRRDFKRDIYPELQKGFVKINPSNYYALVDVMAIDFSSAYSIAIESIDLHCSVLNALGIIAGTIEPKSSFSSYMNKGALHNDWVIGVSDGVFGSHLDRTIALGGFSPHILKNQYLNRYKWRYISNELKSPKSSLFSERTLPSLKWIGKAALLRSNEEVYLYYSLALEALFYESKHGDDLMRELKIRIYKLLFTNNRWMASAVTSFNNFEEMYGLRSKIVHRGGVEVTDDDVALMFNMVIPSLHKILYYSRFRNMDSKNFEQWLMSGRLKDSKKV